jgi:hypothetical protein
VQQLERKKKTGTIALIVALVAPMSFLQPIWALVGWLVGWLQAERKISDVCMFASQFSTLFRVVKALYDVLFCPVLSSP